MNDRNTGVARRSSPCGRVRAAGGWILAAISLLCGACSLIVENNTNQCEVDTDCERLGEGLVCLDGLCASSGLKPVGCYPKEPTTDEQRLNHCTTAECIPFDNCARLGLCGGQALPPLVDPPAP